LPFKCNLQRYNAGERFAGFDGRAVGLGTLNSFDP
jgi:hypothetical protein